MKPDTTPSHEFDQFAQSYCDILDADLSMAGESSVFFAQVKVDRMLGVIENVLGPPGKLEALDVGCGTGIAEECIGGRFARVVGIDVSEEMVKQAQVRVPGARFQHFTPGRLPFEDATFDVVFCFCVFHHVPPPQRAAFVAEMKRVTKPGGLLFSFEHNPYNPLTRRVVDRCAFDKDAVLLKRTEQASLFSAAGLSLADGGYYLFFPGFLRWLRPLEKLLTWLPLGGQYFVAARKPAA